MRRNRTYAIFILAAGMALALALGMAAPASADPAILFVDRNAGGANDGSSWANAFTDLQDALAAAQSGDEIWVATGIYTPGTARTDTFQLKDGVAVYGGFAGGETERDERDWTTNVTVLSGDIDGDDTVDANGVVTNTANIAGENSFHVVTGNGTDESAILDGFTITAGLADGEPSRDQHTAGGLIAVFGSPTLTNLTFMGNQASRYGGALYVYSATPTLTNIRFVRNSSGFRAGAVYVADNGNPDLRDALFLGNHADNGGGGMSTTQSSPSLSQVTFANNTSGLFGGAIFNNGSNPILTNVVFSGNRTTAGSGGAMYNWNGSTAQVTNVTFSGNRAATSGGAIYNQDSSPILHNSILWNNRDSSGTNTATSSINNGGNASPSIRYSLVQGQDPAGEGNLDGTDPANDPRFVTPVNPTNAPTAAGDLRLQAGSPAINAGNNDYVSAVPTDLAGNPRIFGTTVDLGAFEFGLIFVDQTATGANDGSSWVNAFTDLQDALAAAQSGNEIWVATGIYTPGTARTDTFQLKDGVALYGGFAGNETERDARDWAANVTVLSGDIDGDDGVDANIVGDNSYHVVTGSGTNSTAILNGFTVSGGNANSTFPNNSGGGMYNSNGSPALTNVTFSGNSASWGGGMYNNNSSSPTLTNVTFSGNSATRGGGMYNDGISSPTLTNVTFSGNSAGQVGGGIYNIVISSPTLTNVTFSGNRAGEVGGGIYNFQNSSPTLTNVTFSGNSAGQVGGGIYNIQNSSPTLTNVTFSGNSAGNDGGGMYNFNDSNPMIRNSILWNNQDSSGAGTANASIANASNSSPIISYSLVQGQNPAGDGNLDGTDPANDPLFVTPVDPASAPTVAGDLRLRIGSPAIDAGNNDYVEGVETDLNGNPRIVNGTVDLGAYEGAQEGEIPAQQIYLPTVMK